MNFAEVAAAVVDNLAAFPCSKHYWACNWLDCSFEVGCGNLVEVRHLENSALHKHSLKAQESPDPLHYSLFASDHSSIPCRRC